MLWAIGFVMHEDELNDLIVGMRELWNPGCWAGKDGKKEFQVSFWLILFCSTLLQIDFTSNESESWFQQIQLRLYSPAQGLSSAIFGISYWNWFFFPQWLVCFCKEKSIWTELSSGMTTYCCCVQDTRKDSECYTSVAEAVTIVYTSKETLSPKPTCQKWA